VSPLLPDQLDILLQPSAVHWYRKGWRGQSLTQGTAYCEAQGSHAWSAAVAELSKILDKQIGRPTTTVVLSNHFVRYAILPWQEHLNNANEWQDYALHQFTKVYGETVSHWDLRISGAVAGRTRLASAVDSALITALETTFQDSSGKIYSIQPLFMHAYNKWRPAMKDRNMWFALAESGKLCLGQIIEDEWRRLRSHLLRNTLGAELHQLLEQEMLITDEAMKDVHVYLYAPDHGEVSIPPGGRWSLQRLPALNIDPRPLSDPGINSASATP
jgi:hypothetical protein